MAKRLKNKAMSPQTTLIDSAGQTLPTTERQNTDTKRLLAKHEKSILEVTTVFLYENGKYKFMGKRFKYL